jgi:hypothetical protein
MITLALVIFLGICAFLGALVLVSNFFEWLDKKGYDDVSQMIKFFLVIMGLSLAVSLIITYRDEFSGIGVRSVKVITDCQPQGER